MINLRAFTFTATVMALFGLLLCASCAKGPRLAKHPTEFIKDYDLKSLPKFDIPVEINDRVVAWIQYFQGPGRRHFERYLIRSGRYRELISQILKEEKVPQDLIYIALIESGFNPHAYSSAHAVGLWQFIKATGKRYGLNVDGYEISIVSPELNRRSSYLRISCLFFQDCQFFAGLYRRWIFEFIPLLNLGYRNIVFSRYAPEGIARSYCIGSLRFYGSSFH